MDSKQGANDGLGIEMSSSAAGGGKPRIFLEHDRQPGLEAVEDSNLEVVSPKPRLSSNKTWEQTSQLPEMMTYGGGKPVGLYPASDYETGTLHTLYSTLPPNHHSYDHLDHTGTYARGGGHGHPPGGPAKGASTGGFFQQDMILGVRRKLFWIIMAIGVFVIVSAVVIGVGLGVALHKDDAVPATTRLVLLVLFNCFVSLLLGGIHCPRRSTYLLSNRNPLCYYYRRTSMTRILGLAF